ncbi:hypothetical protein RJ640_003028 [Escallonia rubra]|uniref:TF-B3 domain-containing protein n=1 Tax=Escallonia rubra TaxID=112253 RepID=A0AA88QUD4_9ASTE|nr:hypothetical protein RJ640_003028 [Escallonia rubra]
MGYSRSVSLMGSSGNTWEVNLMKNNESLFFNKGWSSFVKDHFAELWDFIVFKYDGNSHFTVKLFDKSGCEKETAFLAKCSQDALKRRRSAVPEGTAYDSFDLMLQTHEWITEGIKLLYMLHSKVLRGCLSAARVLSQGHGKDFDQLLSMRKFNAVVTVSVHFVILALYIFVMQDWILDNVLSAGEKAPTNVLSRISIAATLGFQSESLYKGVERDIESQFRMGRYLIEQ